MSDTSNDQGATAPERVTRTEPFASDATPVTDHQLGVGATIGRYRVRRVVGAGGVGLVLAAEDDELGRTVAIKVLAKEHAEARTRLLREAKAMARLSHPNVVTVHEVLRVGDRTAIVMELVDGQDLASWLTAAPRTWREIVGVYVQAARGLAAAHRAGLVHRDFKPTNALIDRDGVVRVTDFGLVRAAGDPADDADARPGADPLDLMLTRTGAVIGTPAYMAPEQHAGEPVDARTDQWALACALYGALHGVRPFAGDSYPALAASVTAGELREPPRDAPVPRRIRAAIRRALARRADDRFAGMDELIAALTPPVRTGVAVAVGGVALAGAIAAAIVARDGATPCEDLDAPIAATWNAARAAELRARFATDGGPVAAAVDRLIGGLDRYRTGWVAARTRACNQTAQGVGSPELLDRRMRCLDRYRFEVDTLVGTFLAADADAALVRKASGAVESLHPVEDCDEPADTVPRPADPAVRAEIAAADEDVARAWALAELGRFDTGKPLTQRAAAVADRSGWTPLVARAHLQLGRSLSRDGDGLGAVAAFERAATAAAQARDDRMLAEALVARFYSVTDTLGRTEEALVGRPYIELAIERAGNPPRVRATWLHHLAIGLFHVRKYDEALAAEKASGALWRTMVTPANVALRDSMSVEAVIETERGELDRAAELLEQLLQLELSEYGPDHPDVSNTYLNIAYVELGRDDQLAALAHFERGLAIDRAAKVEKWFGFLNVGFVQFELGRWAASIEMLTEGLARAEVEAPGNSSKVAEAAIALATPLVALGELERAAPVVARAVEAARGSGAPTLPIALGLDAQLAVARGDLARARAVVTEARDTPGDPAPTVALAEAALARAARDCAAAEAAYARAIDLSKRPPVAWAVTAATFGAAECQLERGAAKDALAPLEARIAWLDARGAEPAASAVGRFALARALVATGGDRGRARALATSARDGFATLGAAGARPAAEASRWLAAH